ncbi:MAG: asparagine synthase (glutamine-hydrolyzing) [Verrucomicrobiota bacterium]
MCGFALWFTTDRDDAQDRITAHFLQLLRHRGPNFQGSWSQSISPETTLNMAHTRLSILDLSPAGNQPMHDASTGNTIVFNGEIYNFKTLREELIQKGQHFHSHTDTEVLLHGYFHWGEQLLERLDGMFSFVIYDASKKALFIARDHVGIKPLYYTIIPHRGFVFASEARAIAHSGIVPKDISLEAVENYLTQGAVYGPQTIFKNIYEFPPAHSAWIDLASAPDKFNRMRCYWNIVQIAQQPSFSHERHQEILQQTVQQQLISDVPVGLFLSAGIDSTALAESIPRQERDRIQCFTIALPDSQENEASLAAQTAHNLSMHHLAFQSNDTEWGSWARDGLHAMDQPSSDGLNMYMVSRASKISNIIVALCGTGCDELHGGYPFFNDLPYLHRFQSNILGKLGMNLLFPVLTRFHPSQERLRLIYRNFKNTSELIHERRRFFLPSEIQNFWPVEHSSHNQRELPIGFSELNFRTQIAISEIQGYLANILLRDGDWATMANQQELRVPYLGKKYIETTLNIPWKYKQASRNANKPLVASLISPANRHVIHRSKTGFNLNFFDLIARHLREEFHESCLYLNRAFGFQLHPDALMHKMIEMRSRKFDRRMWALLALGFYCKKHASSLTF